MLPKKYRKCGSQFISDPKSTDLVHWVWKPQVFVTTKTAASTSEPNLPKSYLWSSLPIFETQLANYPLSSCSLLSLLKVLQSVKWTKMPNHTAETKKTAETQRFALKNTSPRPFVHLRATENRKRFRMVCRVSPATWFMGKHLQIMKLSQFFRMLFLTVTHPFGSAVSCHGLPLSISSSVRRYM